MSYESVLADLRKMLKQDLFELPPEEYLEQIRAESDRAAIILWAAYIESHIVVELRKRMPSLNADETARIFDFNGPLGSFSSRIWMGQALGLYERAVRRQLDIVREMRNVAAHAHPSVTFTTPEIKAAAISLFEPDLRRFFDLFKGDAVRRGFQYICAHITMIIIGTPPAHGPREMMAEILQRNLHEIKSSRGKQQTPSRQDRPRMGRTGKQPPRPQKSSEE